MELPESWWARETGGGEEIGATIDERIGVIVVGGKPCGHHADAHNSLPTLTQPYATPVNYTQYSFNLVFSPVSCPVLCLAPYTNTDLYQRDISVCCLLILCIVGQTAKAKSLADILVHVLPLLKARLLVVCTSFGDEHVIGLVP